MSAHILHYIVLYYRFIMVKLFVFCFFVNLNFTDMVSTKILLQRVLDDSAQIRTTLQGFSSVLKEMSQVCDIERLQAQLVEADGQVAIVQESFTAPLSQLEHAAAVSHPSLDPNIVLLSFLPLIPYCFKMFYVTSGCVGGGSH